LSLIKTDTFVGQASKLSYHGRVLRAYELLQKVKPELLTCLQGIAEVDVHNSCAKLVQEASTTATPYTFAHYVQDDRARLTIQGFWNPLVPKAQAIPQEVALGTQNGPQVAIVTGPNTGGKSTGLASIGSAVHLSQTLGLVPAQKLEITPFSTVVSGFNMTGRVETGQSLFSASLELANKILAAKKDSTGKLFVALDELFNSTNHTKGQAVAIEFVKKMMEKNNAVMLFATHFPELAKLEAESAGKCQNLKAEHDAGAFAITPGASKATDAFKLISNGDSLLVSE